MGPIHHFAVESPFQVPLLGRREFAVEDHDLRIQRGGQLADLADLAGADQRGRFRGRPLLDGDVEDVRARAFGQRCQLLEGLLDASGVCAVGSGRSSTSAARYFQADEDGSLSGRSGQRRAYSSGDPFTAGAGAGCAALAP